MSESSVLQKIPAWYLLPVCVIVFVLPSIAVTVHSGASASYYFLSLIGLIGAWFGKNTLSQNEKNLLIGFAVFVFCIGLSLINAQDFSESVGSFEKYVRYLLFIPLYIFIRKSNIHLAPLLTWGLILGCFIMALVAIYQFHVLGIERPHGVRHPTRFGFVLMMTCLLLWLQMIVYRHNRKIVAVGVFVTCLVFYAIVLNHTRAAMLMIFPFFALLLFYYRGKLDKKSIFIILGVLILVGLIFVHPSSPVAQHFHKGFAEIKLLIEDPVANFHDSWAVRVHMVFVGMLIFLQSPILGTGLGDYALDAQQMMDAGKTMVVDPILLSTPHNVYVNLLAETGMVGLAALLVCVCVIPSYIYFKFLSEYKHSSEISLYCLSGLTVMACYLLFGLTNTWLTNNTISIFLIFNLVYISSIHLLAEKRVCK